MPFDSNPPAAPSDGYHMLWIEIDNYSILGKYVPFSNQPITTDIVKSRDPRSRKRYQKLVKQEFCTKILFHMKTNLQKQAYNFTTVTSNTENKTLIPNYQKKFDQFHQIIRDTKAKVAKRMGKIFAGDQPWSPKYKRLTKMIKFWIQLDELKKKVNTSWTILKHLSDSLKIPYKIKDITLQQTNEELKKAKEL